MITKIMDCDLLVLGAGGSGLVAGHRAFDLSRKKVIILEKTKKPAGCTYFASGMGESGPIKDSKWQKEAGVKVNEDPQDLSGQFFDWLVAAITEEESRKFWSVSTSGQGMFGAGAIMNPDRTEKYKNLPDHSIGPGRWGSWVVDHLSARCKQVGITLITDTRARKFLKDDKGKVSSCIAETKDGQLIINFKGCIIAAGGYGANLELLKKYYPDKFTKVGIMHSLCPPSLEGDCILAAEEIGARIDPTIRGTNFPGGFFGDGMSRHPWRTGLQPLTTGKCVIINKDGKRWMNEGGGMGGGASGGYIGDQRDGVGIAIVDSTIVEAATSQKSGGMAMMGQDKTTLMEDLEMECVMDETGASGDHSKRADSLVELALKMKIDPRTFVDTIERYNKFCETGKDLDFGKSAQNLQAIKKPPFYAVYCHRWKQSTKGRNGICVDSRFQVLNNKGEVMPGLWSSGDSCTIFGGFVIGSQTQGNWTEEETKYRTTLSKALVEAALIATGAKTASSSQGVMPGGQGGQGGAPGAASGGAPGGGTGAAGGAPGGTQGGQGAPGAGAPSGQGGAPGGQGAGMMMMQDAADSADIFKGKGSPCGGLGPAFLSGFCAGTFAAKYVKDL